MTAREIGIVIKAELNPDTETETETETDTETDAETEADILVTDANGNRYSVPASILNKYRI